MNGHSHGWLGPWQGFFSNAKALALLQGLRPVISSPRPPPASFSGGDGPTSPIRMGSSFEGERRRPSLIYGCFLRADPLSHFTYCEQSGLALGAFASLPLGASHDQLFWQIRTPGKITLVSISRIALSRPNSTTNAHLIQPPTYLHDTRRDTQGLICVSLMTGLTPHAIATCQESWHVYHRNRRTPSHRSHGPCACSSDYSPRPLHAGGASFADIDESRYDSSLSPSAQAEPYTARISS